MKWIKQNFTDAVCVGLMAIYSGGAIVTSLLHSPKRSLEGTVIEEFGGIARSTDSSGLSRNEPVANNDGNYGIVLESQGKTYILQVTAPYDKPIPALAKAIEPGDRVRINCDNAAINHSGSFETIGENGVGTIKSDWISIVEKAKK